ncbi:hypothetical protein PR048_018579 [Dryococelus australis]|uniref:Uncharacterized protein n=1 Tax=Dryococelus australis TaxID=614101 RepID=A0ABQ9HCP0_9NEOP|nr:hypothetical protein PR048_018579 [Dryococelus australis]
MTYYLEDRNNILIHGSFYTEEIRPTKFPDKYLVEKVLKWHNGKAYIKWWCSPARYNSWVAEGDIERTDEDGCGKRFLTISRIVEDFGGGFRRISEEDEEESLFRINIKVDNDQHCIDAIDGQQAPSSEAEADWPPCKNAPFYLKKTFEMLQKQLGDEFHWKMTRAASRLFDIPKGQHPRSSLSWPYSPKAPDQSSPKEDTQVRDELLSIQPPFSMLGTNQNRRARSIGRNSTPAALVVPSPKSPRLTKERSLIRSSTMPSVSNTSSPAFFRSWANTTILSFCIAPGVETKAEILALLKLRSSWKQAGSARTKHRVRELYSCTGVLQSSVTVHHHDGNTARLARRSDEALGVRVSVARIAFLLDPGRAPT